MKSQHTFGYWLRLKRKGLDQTREDLADLVGCSAATIRKLETEERRPSAQIIERLADIFNIPQSERKAFLTFARGDWEAARREWDTDIRWQAGLDPAQSNLPAPATPIIGREDETSLVSGYMENNAIRLVTLIGPPGIGKTRLSLEVARFVQPSFPGGVFFVSLAALEDPTQVAFTVLQALGFVEAKSQVSVIQQIKEGIAEKKVLLVLDNCEHLIEPIASLISALHEACASLKILCTSREGLRVPGEWVFLVPPLAIPKKIPASREEVAAAENYPALLLFSERARAVRADFHLSAENIQSVISICKRLDGLPLALELVAARIRLLPPQALLDRLTDTFVLSADGMRGRSPRQKTIYQAISWSYTLLSPSEQKLFAFLSVFSGGFTLVAAEEIFSSFFPEKPMFELITSLLDKCMLQRIQTASGDARFSMLLTIQQFALSILRQMDIEAQMRSCHLAYYLELAEEGEKEIHGARQASWNHRLESELDNFRAAFEWGIANQKSEAVLRLLFALGWPWEVRGYYSESDYWFEKIRALCDTKNFPALYAGLLNHAGRKYWVQGRFQEAQALLLECQAIALAMGAPGELILAENLNWLGLKIFFGERDRVRARDLIEQGLALFQKWNHRRGEALSTFHLGLVEENDSLALAQLEKSLALFQQFADLFFIAKVAEFIGFIFLRQGDLDQAQMFFDQNLRISQDLQYWDGISDGWRDFGNIYKLRGDYDLAEKCYHRSMAVSSNHGLINPVAAYFSGLFALRRNSYSEARQHFSSLLEHSWRLQQQFDLGCLLFGLACTAAGTNHFEQAAKLFGSIEGLFPQAAGEYEREEQIELDRHLKMTRQHLGDVYFEECLQKGRTMALEQAVALALWRTDPFPS